MNTPNPSEARDITTALQTFFDAEDELKAALDDMPKPASGWDHSMEQRATWQQKARRSRAYQYRAEALTNLRQAAALLTRPTSTPPDAGDSAKYKCKWCGGNPDVHWPLGECPDSSATSEAVATPQSSIELYQQTGLFESPEYWWEVCRLFRARCSVEDCTNLARMRAYIEQGHLVVVRPSALASPHPIERQAGEFVSVPREMAEYLVDTIESDYPTSAELLRELIAAAPAQAAQGDGVTVGMAEAAIQSLAAQAVDAGEDLKMGYRVTQTRMVKALEAAQVAQPK